MLQTYHSQLNPDLEINLKVPDSLNWFSIVKCTGSAVESRSRQGSGSGCSNSSSSS